MSFTFEKQTTNGHDYLEIKGDRENATKVRERILNIPERACDENGKELPVEVIGNHAFSSRKDIEEIHIPDSVHTILGFAFHNCSNLKKIIMTDSVAEYLDGSTRQCENLSEIEININRGNYQIIRRILEDNDRRLTFRMHLPSGSALLVFPGFNYDFVENTMARTIQFAIEGTGYAYRECVKSDEINFREYDNMFSKASADDSITAEMIAMGRLTFPYELSDESRQTYEKWLLKNALKNLRRILDGSNSSLIKADFDLEEHFDFYIKRNLIESDAANMLAHIAADYGKTSVVGMLMNYANRQRSSGTVDSNNDAGTMACGDKEQSGNAKTDGFLELDF